MSNTIVDGTPTGIAGDRWRAKPHVRSMTDADGAVLLDLGRGKYFSLNGIGMRLWARLRQGASLAELVEGLRADYDVPLDVLRSDAERFLHSLRQKGLVDAGE